MTTMTSYALVIKLADRYDNICDLKSSTEEKKQRTINDTCYILDYIEKNRKHITGSQRELMKDIREKIKEYQANETL